MQLFNNIINLFFPNLCLLCLQNLEKSELFICLICKHKLPVIEIKDYTNNKISKTFWGRSPIKKSVSLLEYSKKSNVTKLIYELKYKVNKKIGAFFGFWLGFKLKENNFFKDINFIIPVPIDSKKKKTWL